VVRTNLIRYHIYYGLSSVIDLIIGDEVKGL